MSMDEDPTTLSIARAAAQGYLLIPSITTPISPGTGFSTVVAATSTSNPFITQNSAFDQDRLEDNKFIYRSHGAGRGTFLEVTTSSSSSSTEHLSIGLGVSVGNRFLGASVSGSWSRAVMEDKSRSKMSRKTSFQAGAIRFRKPPPLSAEAKALLLPQNGGYEAFTKRYGDFYVSGYSIGGDAAVLVSQATAKNESYERLKIQLRVKFLCFSRTKAITDAEIMSALAEAELNVMAFDSLDGSFIACFSQDGSALPFEDAQTLAAEYAWRAEEMQTRVQEALGSTMAGLHDTSLLSWSQINRLAQSHVVNRLILVPYSTHREVAQYLLV